MSLSLAAAAAMLSLCVATLSVCHLYVVEAIAGQLLTVSAAGSFKVTRSHTYTHTAEVQDGPKN